jgi:carbonic anhydrase
MMKKRTRFLFNRRPHLLAAALLMVMLPAAFADNKPGVPANEGIARLKAGNGRFILGRRLQANYPAERARLINGQQPYAIVLTCSDSRVPPELVFDESLGKLFVVRVAGNVTDPVALGSIEYAAVVEGARLLVVLGHESCGAVKATLKGDPQPPNIEAIVRKIQPAADRAKARGLGPEATLKLAIEENVHEQINNALKDSDVLRDRVEKKLLTITGGVYQLGSGRVEWKEAGAAAAASK